MAPTGGAASRAVRRAAAGRRGQRRWCAAPAEAATGVQREPGLAWKREGLPSVAEMQWRMKYNAHNERGVRVHGAPYHMRDSTVGEQRAHVETRKQLSDVAEVPGRADRAFGAYKQKLERRRREYWRRQMHAATTKPEEKSLGQWTDEIIKGNMQQVADSRNTRIRREMFAPHEAEVDLALPPVAELFGQLEGLDLAFSSQVVELEAPPCWVLPNTFGSHRAQVRGEVAAHTIRHPSLQSWFGGGDGATVVIAPARHGVWAGQIAAALPQLRFVVVCPQVLDLFRCVTSAARATPNGVLPPNLRFVRAHVDFWWSLSVVADESVDEIIISHPLTFDNHVHSFRRLPTSSFLQLVHPKLRVGGIVRVVTLHPTFHEWAATQFLRSRCEWERVVNPPPDSHFSPLMCAAQADCAQALPQAVTGTELAQREAADGTRRVIRAQEWRKPGPTPELVHDLNREHRYGRVAQDELAPFAAHGQRRHGTQL
eukprot:TRINITY_DN50238_c0_g1_i1.p1 TRINITY_DN50238_c0_g1~~TRINITY_DN50238_c0_g1_i1.p1  ORF type:complete len:508 (+),score=111.01 TRINITY_DN50238_c0_g1_i1:74-1525(+)